MSELPSSWATTPLLAVSELLRGVTYTKEVSASLPASGLLPVLRANNLQGRAFNLSDLVYVPSALVSEQQRIRSGDVVIATSSGSVSVVGKAVQSRRDMDAGFGAFCGVLRPATELDSRYFGHYFSTEAYRTRVSAMARGSNINNLKRQHFESLTFPAAPQAEQQRIADKLDTVLTGVDACRDRLARVAPLLKRFRRSALAAAMTGRLTNDTARNVDAPAWPMVELGTVSLKITDGEHSTPVRSSSGKFLLSARNVRDGALALDDVDYVDLSEFARIRQRCDPSIGDVLLSCSGTVGRAALVDQDETYVMVRSAALIRPDPLQLLAKYLMFALQSPGLQEQIAEASKSTAQSNIFLGPIKKLLVPLPALPDQQAVIAQVETLFAYADRLEARLAQAQTAVNRLTPSLLAKAFRGELVPQDPADEPAAELLKRLAASRPAPVAKTRKPRQGQAA